MDAAGLFNPSISLPSKIRVLVGKHLVRISRNPLLLALAVTCFILPRFRHKEKEVETKGTQTKALIGALAKTQTECV